MCSILFIQCLDGTALNRQQTAAIGIALRNAGYGLQFAAAGDSFDAPAVDELGGIIWSEDGTGQDTPAPGMTVSAPQDSLANTSSAQKEPADPLAQAMSMPCPISKYSGKKLGDVLHMDQHAILWVANKFSGDPNISAAAKLICEQAMEESA